MFDIIMALALLFVGFMMGRASMKGKIPPPAPPDRSSENERTERQALDSE